MAERTSTTAGTTGWARWRSGVLLLASVRKPEFSPRGSLFILALALRLAGAALLVWIGYIHWHLWDLGYRQIHIDGPMFLVDAIVAVVLAVVLLAWPRPLAGLAAAGFTVMTIFALLISLWVGLFGFHESISAAYVVQSLVLEIVAVVILAAWTVLAARAVRSGR